MKLVLIAFFFRLSVCLIVAGLFCAVVWLLNLCGLSEMPSWQMFMTVAVFVYAFIVIRDTYRYIKDK